MGSLRVMGDRMGLGSGLRRALFMRGLRKAQEEPPGGAAPQLGFRVRYVLRIMLREPDRTWPLALLSAKVMISQARLYDLGVAMSRSGLAEVVWFEGRRSIRLTAQGIEEVPNLLAQFRSQRLIMILLRNGPRAAGYALVTHRRDRAWRRGLKQGNATQDPDTKPNELDTLE